MIGRFLHRFRKDDCGAEMIEFAIVIMLLLVFIFGIIEFGWIFNGYITLEAAAKEGARVAIIGASDQEIEAEIEAAVKRQAFTFIDSEDFIDDIVIGTRTGHEASVTVTAKLPLLTGFFFFINNPLEMKATAYMLQES